MSLEDIVRTRRETSHPPIGQRVLPNALKMYAIMTYLDVTPVLGPDRQKGAGRTSGSLPDSLGNRDQAI